MAREILMLRQANPFSLAQEWYGASDRDQTKMRLITSRRLALNKIKNQIRNQNHRPFSPPWFQTIV